MVTHNQSNPDVMQYLCAIQWRDNSRITGHSTVTRSILQLKPVPIWVTFCKCETAELLYCQTDVFVHYRLIHSAIFSVLPVLVWV